MGRYYIKIGTWTVNRRRLARFSRRIRAERGDRCERCGREDGGAEVHHFWETHIYPMLAFEPDNVAVLCLACHDMATRVQRKFPDFAGEFFCMFPVEKQKRLAEFRQRAERMLAEMSPEIPPAQLG